MNAKDRLALHDNAVKQYEAALEALKRAKPYFRLEPPAENKFAAAIDLEWIDQPYFGWCLKGNMVEESVLLQLRDVLNELFPA